MIDDTIAGLSTSVGNSGISVIRLSGSSSFEIADILFKGKTKVIEQKTHTIQYGRILCKKTGEVLDEVLLTKMEAPRTYTRENVVEISSHGGYTIARSLLDEIYQAGARPAEPGEFTKRAFLNGRIDLSQAEAVMDIIQARTERVSKVAVKQLEGSLSKRIGFLEEKLIALLSHIEVNIDYPEYDVEEVSVSMAEKEVVFVLDKIRELIESFKFGKLLREGMEVVITGRPNVGKSSLMNRLAGKNRSIVTDIPGTTRDTIEEYININGIPIKLIDTAGVRETSDQIEQLGVIRSHKAIENADFVIALMDSADHISEEDKAVVERIEKEKKHFIIVFNKIDLIGEEKIKSLQEAYPKALCISISKDEGINILEEKISGFALGSSYDIDNQVLVTNTRHEHQLKKAKDFLDSAMTAVKSGMTLDMIAIDIKSALEELGKITGNHADEDVVNAIFSRFCLGK